MARGTSRTATRKRARRRLRPKSVVPLAPETRELRRVIQLFAKPSELAYRTARDLLNRIVFNSGTGPVGPKDSLLFLLSCSLSGRTLPGYATLDYEHIREIQHVLRAINRYHKDASQKRPLNFLMLASPGAGKSHFIRCIAAELGTQKIGPVTYNMVGVQRHEDLIPPLDAARNFKVEDRLPLLFLDEFDVREDHFPLLLPLLWDGQLTLGQHDLKLGKVVVVLAGSDPRLPGVMENARSMRPDVPQSNTQHPKLVDLLSRINGGVLRLPHLSDPLRAAERRADKICMAVQLLRERFGATLEKVPLALLHFIASAEFRYGVRSIAHLIDLIPHKEGVIELTPSNIKLPLDDPDSLKSSSLAYHMLSDDQAHGVVKAWKESSSLRPPIRIWHETFKYFGPYLEESLEHPWILERLWQEL